MNIRTFFKQLKEKAFDDITPKEFKFINQSGLEFTDISDEYYREYVYPNGKNLIISNPQKLHVGKYNAHKIVDENNKCYYIKPSWQWFEWEPKPGKTHFNYDNSTRL